MKLTGSSKLQRIAFGVILQEKSKKLVVILRDSLLRCEVVIAYALECAQLKTSVILMGSHSSSEHMRLTPTVCRFQRQLSKCGKY